MKSITYFLLFSVLLLTSCEKKTGNTIVDELGSVAVTFKANYGGETFMVNEVYDYNGTQIRIQTLQFYVSEMSLGSEDNDAEVDEIQFLDFNDLTTTTLAEEGIVVGSNNVPVGAYPGINMGIGVLPEYNVQKPDLFASTHPLSNTATYWADWNSYIFLKLEGSMDTDGDGMFDDVNFVYHVGSDETYEGIEIDQNLSLTVDENMELTVLLDVEKLFVRDGSYLDIAASPMIHNINQLETGHYLMDNFSNALTIE